MLFWSPVQLLEVETGLRGSTPVEGGALAALGMPEVGRRSPGAGRPEASEEAVGHDGSCVEDRTCTASCGLEETGLRHPAVTGLGPANWFSASSTADKKSYKEETVGLGTWRSRNTLLSVSGM